MNTEPSNEPARDPLAQITVRPRVFLGVLALLALLTGLVLALVPVRVASPDPVTIAKVSCGNTLGGVETPRLATALGGSGRELLVSYIGMCERAIDERAWPAWTLFFGGLTGGLWLGVVRQRPRARLTTG